MNTLHSLLAKFGLSQHWQQIQEPSPTAICLPKMLHENNRCKKQEHTTLLKEIISNNKQTTATTTTTNCSSTQNQETNYQQIEITIKENQKHSTQQQQQKTTKTVPKTVPNKQRYCKQFMYHHCQSFSGLTLLISFMFSLALSVIILVNYTTTTTSKMDIPDNCVDSCCVFCDTSLSSTIQLFNFWNDSKYFVDCPLKISPLETWNKWNDEIISTQQSQNRSAVYAFWLRYFDPPASDITECKPLDYNSDTLPLTLTSRIADENLLNFTTSIYHLWTYLCRTINDEVYESPELHTLLPLRHSQMIVSGGRFRESYYWDSFWIIKGLLVCNMTQSARWTVDNLMYLAKDYGHEINGNRLYYQHRSQPPLLAMMFDVVYEWEGRNLSYVVEHSEFVDILAQDYYWWMDTQSVFIPVPVQNETEIEAEADVQGYRLNYYFIDSDNARPEGYVEDMRLVSKLVDQSAASRRHAFSSIKSGAESGWDFSSRWCFNQFCSADMTNIDTINVIPVDLNAYLYKTELLLAKFYGLLGNSQQAELFSGYAEQRLLAFETILYDESSAQWRDYDLRNERQIEDQTTVSNYIPLWVLPHNDTMAVQSLTQFVNKSQLMREGGIATTLVNDTQQWDFPNSWAPNMYIMAEIAQLYKHTSVGRFLLANITQTYINSVYLGWQQSHLMHEKYNVLKIGETGTGGEYIPQKGFSWTNGVAFSFLYDYGTVLKAPTLE